MKLSISKIYSRFLAWQHNPVSYVNKSQGTVRCANCGTEFADNFCPRCGQRAGIERVTWETVRQSVMLLWGFESRSFPYTLLQLLLRPGYLISDYICGRRQMSYPPVKMLILVTLFYGVIRYLANKIWPEEEVVNRNSELWDNINAWMQANPGWGMLIICSLLLVPTWVLFRHSPRNKHHTIPAGFFIQVFMGSLFLLICSFDFLGDWLFLLLPLYLIIAYRQLFGFSWWTTIWRLGICFIIGCVFFIVLSGNIDFFGGGFMKDKVNIFQVLRFDFITLSCVTLLLAFIALIDSQRARRAHCP